MGGKRPKTIITDQDKAMKGGNCRSDAKHNTQKLPISYQEQMLQQEPKGFCS